MACYTIRAYLYVPWEFFVSVNVTVIQTSYSIFDRSLREIKRTEEQEFPCHYLLGVRRRHDRLKVITSCKERLQAYFRPVWCRHSPHVTQFHVSYVRKKKKPYKRFEMRAEVFLAGLTAHWDDVGGRILLGDNTGCGAVMLRPIRVQCVGF